MASRLRAHLPRVAFFVLLGLAATATLTYAAGRRPARAPGNDGGTGDDNAQGGDARRHRKAGRSKADDRCETGRHEDDVAAEPPGCVRRPRREQGAARRDAAPEPRAAPAQLARRASQENARQRLALALPERLDRRRREARLVAGSRGTQSARRGRSSRSAALGDRLQERVAGPDRSERRAIEVELRSLMLRLAGGEQGYTLIELLVTMVILSTVLAGLTTVFVSGSNAEAQLNRRF